MSIKHTCKILSLCLLNRLRKGMEWFLSEWEAGGVGDGVIRLSVAVDGFCVCVTDCNTYAWGVDGIIEYRIVGVFVCIDTIHYPLLRY